MARSTASPTGYVAAPTACVQSRDIVKFACKSLPSRTADDLLRPFSVPESDSMPEWTRSYMSLLAESSTSGNMQRHLAKFLASSAANTAKFVGFLHDPLNPLTGHLANTGSEMLLNKHSQLMSMDDSCLPSDPNPMHGKMLSLMLSMVLSGAISETGLGDALPSLGDLPLFSNGMSELTQELQSKVGIASIFAADPISSLRSASALSMQRAPSVLASSAMGRAQSGMDAMFGAGGMASSTVMKLLRADSKHMVLPDLGNVLETVLDSVNESIDDGDAAHITQSACSRGKAMGAAMSQSRRQ